MKKVPSYPKISSKTNITVTQTHNININSPKALGAFTNSHKLFKHKGSMQAAQDSEFRTQFKTRPTPTKSARRQSSGNLNKMKQSEIIREPTGNKTQIRKIEEKLKQLQKKIDTLKVIKKKKKEMPFQRSQSKIKETQVTIIQKKASLGSFKKKEGSLRKALKKTQSDKYLLKSSIPPKSQNPLNLTTTNHQKQDEELIHKFVTQVNRSEANKHIQHKNEKIACYYIENALESIHKNYLLPFRQHLTQSIQTLKYLQNNRKPTAKQIERHSISLPPNKFKYSLILDLDETLIHCNQNLSLPHDVTLKIKFPTGEKVDAGINVRPFAKQLLEQLSKVCEVIVFTASHQCYANVVLNHLDPKGDLVTHRLFRSHCWQTQQGVYIKDLRVLKNRSLQNILLVDNAAYSYFYQLQNGIPIIPFYDDKDDEQLLHLIHYIKDLIEIKETQKENVSLQQLNHRYFQLSSYSDYENVEVLTTKLYKETIVRRKKMIL